jgi:hypothetical protein
MTPWFQFLRSLSSFCRPIVGNCKLFLVLSCQTANSKSVPLPETCNWVRDVRSRGNVRSQSVTEEALSQESYPPPCRVKRRKVLPVAGPVTQCNQFESNEGQFLQEPHGVTSQKTPFFLSLMKFDLSVKEPHLTLATCQHMKEIL